MKIYQFCIYALSNNFQVNRATSFMNHLLTILSEQRHFAYNLFDQLNQFQHAIFLLGSGGIFLLYLFNLGLENQLAKVIFILFLYRREISIIVPKCTAEFHVAAEGRFLLKLVLQFLWVLKVSVHS